jgi:hypothetical protein
MVVGPDDKTPPETGAKPVGAKLHKQQLQPRFRWPHYWEVQQKPVTRSRKGKTAQGPSEKRPRSKTPCNSNLTTPGGNSARFPLFRDNEQQLVRTCVVVRARKFHHRRKPAGRRTRLCFSLAPTDPAVHRAFPLSGLLLREPALAHRIARVDPFNAQAEGASWRMLIRFFRRNCQGLVEGSFQISGNKRAATSDSDQEKAFREVRATHSKLGNHDTTPLLARMSGMVKLIVALLEDRIRFRPAWLGHWPLRPGVGTIRPRGVFSSDLSSRWRRAARPIAKAIPTARAF